MSTTDTRNYYERELDLIDFTGKHPAKILIGCEGKVTRTLDVNRESATAIISKLVQVYGTDIVPALDNLPKRIFKPAPVKKPAPFLTFKTGRDVNGNKTVKVKGASQGFSIQTNGNLRQTDRDGVGEWTIGEVREYVQGCGTARQRAILGI